MHTLSSPAAEASASASHCDERLTSLRLCPLFSHLPEHDIRFLASQASLVHFSTGQAILQRGQRASHALLVNTGIVRL
ncbi:hypothetical protein V2S84_17945, partial [Azotobacter chroococcum]|nr:hypothetical protein [Azotobacter chroococcum]